MAELKYHALAYRLLGTEPVPDPEAVRVIERGERKAGARLPAAVREWYSLAGAVDLLALRPGVTRVATVEQVVTFLPRRPWLSWVGSAEPQSQTLAAQTDPYYHAVTRFETGEPMTGLAEVFGPFDPQDPPVWENPGPLPQPVMFSAFVLNTVWRRDRSTGHRARWAVPGAVGISPAHVDFLLERFEALPDRRVLCDTANGSFPAHVRRFFRGAERVEVWADDDPATGVRFGAWQAVAPAEGELFALLAELWPCHGMELAFFRPGGQPAPELGERMRERFPWAGVKVAGGHGP